MVTRRKERGVSLVEIVASLAVLAAVGGAGAWLGTAHFRGIARAHEENAALRAAEARIEALRCPHADLAAGARAFDIPTRPSLPCGEGTETLERAAPGLVRATVVVAWDAADGGRATVRLATLVAEETGR